MKLAYAVVALIYVACVGGAFTYLGPRDALCTWIAISFGYLMLFAGQEEDTL